MPVQGVAEVYRVGIVQEAIGKATSGRSVNGRVNTGDELNDSGAACTGRQRQHQAQAQQPSRGSPG